MSYLNQARITKDGDLLDRVTACVAGEGEIDPAQWVYERRWLLSAQHGWVGAYSVAIATGSAAPGADESAITDGMILSAVQSIRDSHE